MREMKNSGIEWIGEIPATWELKRIKALFLERKEKNDPVQTDFILSLGAAYGVVPYTEKEGGGNKAKEDLTDYRLAYPGDIVMNSMNVISGSVGMSKYFGCVSPVYYMLYPRQNNVDPIFFCYMFQAKAFQRSLLGLGNGILMKETNSGNFNTVRTRIPMEKLGVQLLPFPSFAEQKQISETLDRTCAEIDVVITTTKKTIEEYKKLKQSIITDAVTKGIRGNRSMKDSGIKWIDLIPCDWEIYKFGRCVTIKSNLVAPENYLSYPQIAPDNIEKGSARLLNNIRTVEEVGVVSWNHLFHKGQIIYSKIRPMLNKLVIAPFDGLCSADMYPIETENDTDYIVFLMLSDLFLSQVGLVTINRVKMPKINQNELANIRVPMPEIEEQREIAEYLKVKCRQLDEIIDKKEKYLSEIENYKNSLIYEYVTGKKEVP